MSEPTQPTTADTILPPAPTAPTPPKTVTPKATPVVENVIKNEAPPTTLATIIAQIKQNGSVNEKAFVTALEQYTERMAPGKIIEARQGDSFQYALWKSILTVINTTTPEEFTKLWSLLLNYVNAHIKDVFGDRYVFRFSEYWTHSQSELTAFQRILNLIILTADPKTRTQSLRQVNINATLAEVFTDADRQKIISFYRL